MFEACFVESVDRLVSWSVGLLCVLKVLVGLKTSFDQLNDTTTTGQVLPGQRFVSTKRSKMKK